MKVAVENSGPGVAWPTAMASRSCVSVDPAEPLHELGAKQGDEDVAAPEQDARRS